MKRIVLLFLLLSARIVLAQNISGDPFLLPPHRLIFGDPGTPAAAYLQHTAPNTVALTGNLTVTGTCTNCGSGGGVNGLVTGNVPNSGSSTNLVPSSAAIAQSGGSTFNAGPFNATAINGVIKADQFAGANGGTKITAALANCPATGGVVDARGLLGAQAITASITVPPYCQLLLGSAQYTSTVIPVFRMKDASQLIGMSQSYQLTGGTVLNVPGGAAGGAIQPFDTTNGNFRVVLRDIRLGHGNPITADGSIGVDLNPAYEWVLENVNMHGFDTGIRLGTTSAGAFYNTLNHVHVQNGATYGFYFSFNATQNSCYDCSYQGGSINTGTGFNFNANAFGNALYTPDIETAAAGIGIALSGRSNSVYTPYLEGLLTGISLDASASFDTVIGGIVTSVGTAVFDASPLYAYNVVIMPGAQGTASPTNSPVVYPKFWSSSQYAIQGAYPRGVILNKLGTTSLAAIGVPTALSRTTNVVTVTLSGGGIGYTPRVGQQIVIAGAATGAGATVFNGTFAVASAASATSFTYNQTAADDTSTGGGTATVFDSLAVDTLKLSNGSGGAAIIQSFLDNNSPIFSLPGGAGGGYLTAIPSGSTTNNIPKFSGVTGQLAASDITDLATGTTIVNNSAGTGTLTLQNNSSAGASAIAMYDSTFTLAGATGYFSPAYSVINLQNSVAWASNGKAIKFSHNILGGATVDLNIDTSGNAQFGGNVTFGQGAVALAASLVTTAAATDNVTVTGMTSSGHCAFSPTNALAATNIATTFVSAKTTNQITVTHTASANMNYDILCTAK